MTKNHVQLRNSVLLLFLFAAAIFRITGPSILPTWANFTPIGAMALFGGTYFKPTWKAYLLPLGIILLSDIALNKMMMGTYNPFYSGFWATYLTFIFITYIGTNLRKVSIPSVFIASLIGVIFHWIVTDIQPWISSTTADGPFYYTKDFSGFIKCLYMAIPFEIRFLESTLIFSALFFTAFEWLKSQYPALQTSTKNAIQIP